MTDFQLLLLILGLLYLSESVFWVRRGSVVFRSLLGRRFKVVDPSPGLGMTGPGAVLLNALPPLGTAFLCHQWPLSITADAICSFVPNVINGNDRPDYLREFVRFSEIHSIACDGAVILINGHPFARLNSEMLAAHFADLLGKLQRLPAASRDEVIDASLRSAFDLRRIGRRVERFRRVSRPLPLLTHFVLVVLFVPIPLSIGVMAFRLWLLPSLAALVAVLLLTVQSFFEAHRRLYPRAGGGRWRSTLTMLFAPMLAIRAKDMLSRDLLARFHPLAVGLALCSESERRAFARRIWLDIEHPMGPAYPSDDADERATIDAFQDRLRSVVREVLVASGEDPVALSAPPVLDDDACLAYCPRCQSQFLIATGRCSHCGDLKLLPFATASAPGPASRKNEKTGQPA